MAANPRKFSEKIALHNQKQAEETAAFEKIMKEVGTATRTNESVCQPSQKHISPPLGSYGGSLPNVNLTSPTSIDLQSALSSLEEIKSGRHAVYRDKRSGVGGPGPGGGNDANSGQGPGPGPLRSRPMDARRNAPMTHHVSHPYSTSMAGSIGGMVGVGMCSSPVGGSHLLPPADSSWRRTHSDSALHQTAMGPSDNNIHNGGASPIISRRMTDGNSSMMHSGEQSLLSLDLYDPRSKGLMVPAEGRPKSCSDMARIPGISICPSAQDNSALQIPIGNNTGSLPDLTNLQFSSPLPTPLDIEDSGHPQSPYSPSAACPSPGHASPGRLSPYPGNGPGSGPTYLNGVSTNVPSSSSPASATPFTSLNIPALGSGSSTNDMGTGSNRVSGLRGTSPGPTLSGRRRHHHHLQNLVLGTPPRSHTSVSPGCSISGTLTHTSGSPHLLNVPSVNSSRYLHTSKGIVMDSAGNQMSGFLSNQYLYQNQASPQPGDYSPAHSPTQRHAMSPPSQPIPMHHHNVLTAYRNPQPLLRPSPQNSPGLTVPCPMVYRSNSPGDNSLVNSAPPSPVSQSLSPASSPGIAPSPASPFSDLNNMGNVVSNQGQHGGQQVYFHNQANAIQQQFEQFNMMDSHSSGFPLIQNYDCYKPDPPPYHQQAQLASLPLTMDLESLYYSPSSTHLLFGSNRGQQTTPQTPQTPSSIPDIILQDFSNPSEDLPRHSYGKDLSSVLGMNGVFEASDYFPSDDALKAGLDPIDLDGLQMLTDPDMNVVCDPSAEDHFRLDRL